jgi:hypothetical protein
MVLALDRARKGNTYGEDMLWHLFAFRLGVALFLGAFIGAERQWRQRMAGPVQG